MTTKLLARKLLANFKDEAATVFGGGLFCVWARELGQEISLVQRDVRKIDCPY